MLLRGLPGAGKTSLAEFLLSVYPAAVHFEADQFFVNLNTGAYSYDKTKIKEAHRQCSINTQAAMQQKIPLIIVANVFAQNWTVNQYINLASEYSYKVVSLVVENRCGSTSTHNVPAETIKRMRDAFQISF